MTSRDTVAIVETAGAFRKRNGSVKMNCEGRVTTLSWSKRARTPYCSGAPPTKQQVGWGHVSSVGGRGIRKDATVKQMEAILAAAKPKTDIVVQYPTDFCVCGNPSWYFLEFYERGHRTCPKCGLTHKINKAGYNLHLNEDGHQNKSQWNFTPGMESTDSMFYKRGRRMQVEGQKTKSHERNFWRIKRKIDDFLNRWHFDAMKSLIKTAKNKLRLFYKSIHPRYKDSEGADVQSHEKLPHGGAALAAACFYATILEFEHRTHQRTVCTLPAIAEFAQTLRDKKSDRQTRDVTENVILRYAKRIKRRGYCSVRIPELGAKTLRFKPKSASLEHARMAVFSQCVPFRFALPSDQTWGIDIKDTKQGVLVIHAANTTKAAFSAGLRQGDYIFELNRDVVGVSVSPSLLETKVKQLRQKDNRVIEVTIMRKKKN